MAKSCPRGDFHPLIATEELPVGGFGLGHSHDDNNALNNILSRLIYKVIYRFKNKF